MRSTIPLNSQYGDSGRDIILYFIFQSEIIVCDILLADVCICVAKEMQVPLSVSGISSPYKKYGK
jgi:hypothetical protein